MDANVKNKDVTMEIYRKEPLPRIFAELPFVREGLGSFVDSFDDIQHVELFRDIVRGKRCVSELDTDNRIVAKIEMSPEMVERAGTSGEIITWRYFYWKPHDVSHVCEPGKPRPYEAVSVEDAGLDSPFSL